MAKYSSPTTRPISATINIDRLGTPSERAHDRVQENGERPLRRTPRRYDDMVARMRTAEVASGVDALFKATPKELGRAAVRAAKRG